GDLQTAVTVCLPDRVDGPAQVMFGFPGGGFNRHYYNVRRMHGYSQAEYHPESGFAVVACDHLGVGDSSHPDMFDLTYENLAAANHATAEAVVSGLRDGSLAPGAPSIDVDKTIGMGQSM